MRRADANGSAAAEGVAIAREIALELKGRVQGFQITAASGNIAGALALLEEAAVART
jgi:hypothetical protein